MIAYSFLKNKKCTLQGKSISVDGLSFQISQIVENPVPIERQRRGISAVLPILVSVVMGLVLFTGYLLIFSDPGNDIVAFRVTTVLFIVLLDPLSCVLVIGTIRLKRILQKARSVWMINEGKSFAVELDDDPSIESKLKELIDPSLTLATYPFMARPPIRRLYLAIPVALFAFTVEVTFVQQFVQKAGLFVSCMLAAFVGLFACAAIVFNQRFREMRWKPYPINKSSSMNGQEDG